MVSPACLAKIKTKPPPLNVACPSICSNANFINGTHCSTLGLPVGEPFITNDPNFGGPGVPGYCYCCCSCFTADTPIEAKPDEFMFIQDINAGDTLLATGSDLKWTAAKVLDRSGGYDKSVMSGLYLVVYKFADEEGVRQILVTPGHLFLTATQKKLKPVQNLIPSDRLMRNDGQAADVLFVAPGEHNTAIHTLLMDGAFDGKNLDGHLVNANGLVTADFVVQMHFESENVAPNLAYAYSKDETILETGTSEYAKRFDSPELHAFLQDEDAWPNGFRPYREENLVNIPLGAVSFLTLDQAVDVANNAQFNTKSNTVPRTEILRLFKSYRALHPDTICLIDWENPIPNAYAWKLTGQNVILITGGLARVTTQFMDAFSLILSVMQSHIQEEKYVCWADYNATAYLMRDTWTDSLYVNVVTNALDQVSILFGYVSKKNAQGNPAKPGKDPSLDCRLKAFQQGLSFLGVPECGKPLVETFRLERASTNHALDEVTLTFSAALEEDSTENVTNYVFLPEVIVKATKLEPNGQTQVILSVEGLVDGVNYMITVHNILSEAGIPISPGQGTVVLKA